MLYGAVCTGEYMTYCILIHRNTKENQSQFSCHEGEIPQQEAVCNPLKDYVFDRFLTFHVPQNKHVKITVFYKTLTK